jgi:hypothetical protein
VQRPFLSRKVNGPLGVAESLVEILLASPHGCVQSCTNGHPHGALPLTIQATAHQAPPQILLPRLFLWHSVLSPMPKRFL